MKVMAYMGRGGFSSFKRGENNNRGYQRGGFFGVYYYIPLDNTYVIFQMIASIIIFIIAGVTFLTTYKSPVIDTIADIKKSLINSHIIIILVLLGFTLLANYFSKDKYALIKKLVIIIIISIITILTFFGIKVNMDSIYTENKFAEIYEQEYTESKTSDKNKIDIGLTGVSIKSEKEYYIDKCIEAYNVFTIKMYSSFAINDFLIILLIYEIIKVLNIQEKKDRLSKDDAILFDEEENIKIQGLKQMNDMEKEFIKKVNIDKAKNKAKDCISLTIFSILTYIVPLLFGDFDFGLVFELLTLIFIFIARNNMKNYDEDRSKRYTIFAMIPIGWLLIYDFITLIANTSDAIDLTFLWYDFILGDGITILIIIILYAINKDLRKADNPEKYKESTDWFYERLDEKDTKKK